METTPPTLANRLWHIVRVVFFMLRKGISKRKLVLDLHLLLKHGKLAGKTIGNLLAAFHHHRHPQTNSNEVEFSCSTTPSYPHNYFHATSKRNSHGRRRRDKYHSFIAAEMANALRMMNAEDSDAESVAPSAFPTPSPAMTRQLRVTDSPFPINENEVVDGGVIDKEADKFIKKFYEQLLRQQLGCQSSTPDTYGYRRGRRHRPELSISEGYVD